MTLSVKHAKASTIGDVGDDALIEPSDWNAEHQITGTLDVGSISGAGTLSKTDDTNVTLTLGGTPTGSLLSNVSLTLGWTGTLANSRLTNPSVTISGHTLSLGGTLSLAQADITGLTTADTPTLAGLTLAASSATNPALNINTLAASLQKGAVITQTSPTSGTTSAAPLIYNLVNVNNQYGNTTSGTDPWLKNYAVAQEIKLTEGGSNVTGFQIAQRIRLDHTVGTSATGFDHIAQSIVAYSNQDATGRNFWAGDAAVWAASGAHHPRVLSYEFENILDSGATVQQAIGLRIGKYGAINGSSNIDTAITFKTDAGGHPWQKLFAPDPTSGSTQIVATTGDIFYLPDAITIANFTYAPSVIVTGSIQSFPDYNVTGKNSPNGVQVLIGGSTSSQALGILVNSTTKSGTNLTNSNSGGVTAWTAFNDLGATNLAEVGIRGSARATYGALIASDGYLYTSSTGLTIMADNASAVIKFAAKGNAQVAQLGNGLSVGAVVDPGAGLINANVGFRVANAATSTHVLRGNGTNFVDAALAAADLSNGVTGSGSVVLATAPTIAGGTASGLGKVSRWTGGYVAGRYYITPCRLSSTVALANATVYYFPLEVGETHTFDRIAIQVTTTGTATLVRLAIYNAAGGIPTSLVVDGGTVSVAGTGIATVTISQSLAPGIYWLAVVADGTVTVASSLEQMPMPAFTGVASFTAPDTQLSAALTFGAFPSTAGAVTYTGANAPIIGLRA